MKNSCFHKYRNKYCFYKKNGNAITLLKKRLILIIIDLKCAEIICKNCLKKNKWIIVNSIVELIGN